VAHHGGVTATDSFHDFVGQLADALGDGDVGNGTGEDWAARLHFSRFHFDRMISSVAGEPPGAFRRRILLERAAYRMITTRAPLIDIAVEAGYGSHEAFTRAFARAYGTSPAAWRKNPTQIRIAAPSGVHFHPPGSLRLPARPTRKVTAMELLTAMVEHHVWLIGEMIRVSERLSDEQLDQSIGLAVHDDEQLESLRSRLAVEGPRYLAHVRDVVARDALDETFVDACGDRPHVFTYGGNLAHVLTFAAHRRTLVVLALARHGLDELGWGDPTTRVADATA
jgi:AraC family transcriptional regulator